MSGDSWSSPLGPCFFLQQLPNMSLTTVVVITIVILLEMVHFWLIDVWTHAYGEKLQNPEPNLYCHFPYPTRGSKDWRYICSKEHKAPWRKWFVILGYMNKIEQNCTIFLGILGLNSKVELRHKSVTLSFFPQFQIITWSLLNTP